MAFLRLFTRLRHPYGLRVRKWVLLGMAAALAIPTPALADDVGQAASAAAPQSSAGYAFFSARNATTPRAYWNPCGVIRYGIDPTRATRAGMRSSWEIARWRSTVAAASQAMGVRFHYVGRIRTSAAGTRPARVPGVDVVITYGSAKRSGRYGYGASLAGATAGVSGVQWTSMTGRSDQITRGYVVIDAREATHHTTTWTRPFDARPATQRSPDPLRALYLHEFGHALGLKHVADPAQLMYPQISSTRPDVFGSGDLAGLRALGTQACF